MDEFTNMATDIIDVLVGTQRSLNEACKILGLPYNSFTLPDEVLNSVAEEIFVCCDCGYWFFVEDQLSDADWDCLCWDCYENYDHDEEEE